LSSLPEIISRLDIQLSLDLATPHLYFLKRYFYELPFDGKILLTFLNFLAWRDNILLTA
jgi:hypothetical protein